MNTYTVIVRDNMTGEKAMYYITCDEGAEYAAVKALAEHLGYQLGDFNPDRFSVDIQEGIGGQFGGVH